MGNTPLKNNTNILTNKNIVTIDTAQATYNYYGFISKDGAWVILREKQDTTEYKYAVGSSNFDTGWGNKLVLDYHYPNSYPNA